LGKNGTKILKYPLFCTKETLPDSLHIRSFREREKAFMAKSTKSKDSRIRRALRNLFQRIYKKQPSRKEPDLPEDPYAYVTAPKKPRPSNRSAAAVAEPPEE
jgi:hypothetical protein